MMTYLKSAVWDCILCIAASAALAFTVCSGFYATQPYQQDIVGVLAIIGICIAVCVVSFAVSLNRRTMAVGVPLAILSIIAAFAMSFTTSEGASVFDDVAGNRVFFALCAIGSPLVVFLLSRNRVTTALLIVCGVLLCAIVEYLYWYGHIASCIVFLVAASALFVYRTYQRSLLASESDSLAFSSVTITGVALVGVSALVSLGVFAVVIAPLDPPHLVVKLVTEHFRIEEIEVRGVASVSDATDQSLVSNVMAAVTVASSQVSDQLEDQQSDDQIDQGDNEQDSLGFAEEGVQDTPVGVGLASLGLFERPWLVTLLALGLILLVLIAIAAKKVIRARRYRTMISRGPDEAVRALYLFFIDRFHRLKMSQPETSTLREYVEGAAEVLDKFERGSSGPAFTQLTDVYMRCEFGGEQVSDDDLSLFQGYYRAFYRRACRYTGRLRYVVRFFFV